MSEQNQLRCPSCGVLLRLFDATCPSCGSPIPRKTPSAEEGDWSKPPPVGRAPKYVPSSGLPAVAQGCLMALLIIVALGFAAFGLCVGILTVGDARYGVDPATLVISIVCIGISILLCVVAVKLGRRK